MPVSVSILHLEDSALDCELACAHLAKAGIPCTVTRVDTRDGFSEALDARRYDLILADFSLPAFDGMEALRIARERTPQTPFLFLSGRMGEETAVEALKQGARDYVLKHRLARLPAAVIRAIDEAQTRAERQRAEDSLNRLHQAIDDIRDYAIFTLDLDGRITSWNEGSRRLFGHSEADVLGQPLALLFAPEDRSGDEVDSALAQAAATGRHEVGRHEVEWLHAACGGRRFWGSCVLTTVRDGGGSHVGYSVVVRDVTERRAAEAALRESEARFRTITNAMPQLVWTATPDGVPDYFNENWCDYTGRTVARSIGDGWAAALHPDDRERAVACWAQSARTGDGYEIEYRLRRADGAYRWFLGRARILRDDSGRILRWFGTCTDIDDAVAARKALTDSRKGLERLVEARTAELVAANERLRAEVAERERAQADLGMLYAKTPVPLHSLDSQGRLLSVSDRWLEFMGYDDRAQVLGRHVTDFMTEEDARAYRAENWPALLRDGVIRDRPYRFIKGSGEVADILVSARVERDGQGKFLRTMGAIVDVTARLRAEAERERAEEALRHAQKMDALGQLTGGIAHDFNNLLTAITGNLELLITRLGSAEPEALRDYALHAKAGATRAAALTQRLLAFARRQPLRPDATEPDRLVRGMADLLRRTVGEQIAIDARMPEGVWPAWCDANQLEIALLNLAVNARDAMPAGGHITIAAENVRLSAEDVPHGAKPGDYVHLSVGDTGSGMPPDVISHAFDPFFTTKPIGQGTGLGLSQVYGFVNQSLGLVRIESQPGQGTTVHLYLPRCLVERVDREKVDREKAGPPVEGPGPGPLVPDGDDTGGTILIVEDEALVRMVAVQALEDAGLEVIEAASAAEALELLDGGVRADLLVTDVGLPGMNGRQLAEAVRARRPELGVLFMTGYAYDATLGTGILEPGCEVLQKPFETSALVARVAGMLAGAGGGFDGCGARQPVQERRCE